MSKNIYTNNHKYLLKVLKQYRKMYKITQKELADKLDIAQSRISKIENGDRKIDVMDLIKISKAIGCNPIEIFSKVVNNWIDE
ncbi:helix-turn-helix transcriptional regulator [bacterium]|nr:helix-turn-helix transcriptional regulator [bacterium]MDE6224461.1 helix-turn-helix transcriptional regulator [Alphaproteobacteria bacterium]